MSKAINQRIDSHGNLKSGTRGLVLKGRKKPDTLWNSPILLVIVILLCAVVDFTIFRQLFDAFLLDHAWIRWTSILGMLFAFDFVPVYLGLNLRKKLQGYNVFTPMLWAMLSVFALAFIANAYLRISFMDLVLPPLTQGGTAIFGDVATAETVVSERALPWAIFASIVPLLTSIGGFTISFFMNNPLKKEAWTLEKERVMLEDRIGEIDAVLEEYAADPDFGNRLLTEDKENFDIAQRMIKEKCAEYRAYVRERIIEHLRNATAANILSKELDEEDDSQ